MKLGIVIISLCLSVVFGKLNNLIYKSKPPSVLVIGSSVPALVSALALTEQNISVTLVYSTKYIENAISPTSTIVKDVTYRLPKHHPAIFEHSTMTRNLAKQLGNTFSTLSKLYLHVTGKDGFFISDNEWILSFLASATKSKCFRATDTVKAYKIIRALKNYKYSFYRQMYSNITLAQFARIMKAPPSFISCFLTSSMINFGSPIENVNAADAIARMQFYYLSGSDGLRSYHMNNHYDSTNTSKLLIDQIVSQLKLKNTTFISNYTLEALWVDPNSGRVLGDINKRNVQYDYTILGDKLNGSRLLLETTKEYNTGAPKIFDPLDMILNSLKKYNYPPIIQSIKFWMADSLKEDRASLIEVNNSPFPNSIQSIRQINKLSGIGNQGNILEVIIADINSTSKLNWEKIIAEIIAIFPEFKSNSINKYRVDPIDLGVSMDTAYGMNRLSTSSLINFGIPNLILSADWLDTNNTITSCDLEKSVVIGYQAANKILKDISSHHYKFL